MQTEQFLLQPLEIKNFPVNHWKAFNVNQLLNQLLSYLSWTSTLERQHSRVCHQMSIWTQTWASCQQFHLLSQDQKVSWFFRINAIWRYIWSKSYIHKRAFYCCWTKTASLLSGPRSGSGRTSSCCCGGWGGSGTPRFMAMLCKTQQAMIILQT